ncbi:MAG: hypothetical protein EKK56_05525 [Flavobacteriaceae bacterium]|nr:MAG: hypothetical protein EKK56_05525 [Flavobacteriaceae bacterium]
MGNTKIIFKKEHFNIETTQEFLKDFDEVCKTMDSDLFVKLFIKYDFYYDESYREVLDLIINQTSNWYNPDLGTELLEVRTFDSKCAFCFFSKTVNGYEWTYINRLDKGINSRITYSSKIGFIFEYENNNLIEFGVCNSFVD